METDYFLAPEKQQLYKWGLCIPMWANSSEKENWHIQPIETLGIDTKRQFFLDEDDLLTTASGYRVLRTIDIPGWTREPVYMQGSDVKRFQRAAGITVDGWFGADSNSAAIALQTANGLTADGIIGDKTWAVIATILGATVPPPAIDYKTLFEAEQVKSNNLRTDLATITKSLLEKGDLITNYTKEIAASNLLIDTINRELATAKDMNASLVLSNNRYMSRESRLIDFAKLLDEVSQ
jgi:hypothetical protein